MLGAATVNAAADASCAGDIAGRGSALVKAPSGVSCSLALVFLVMGRCMFLNAIKNEVGR